MREELKAKKGERLRFKGVFAEYRLKRAYKGLAKETMLFRNITLSGEEVTDHLWFNLTKGFRSVGPLYPGDVVAFDARVVSYVKGYVGRDEDHREVDYKLSHPTKIVRVGCAPHPEGYYLICPECGYHNRALNFERCRRCSYSLGAATPPTVEPPGPVLKQSVLGG